MKKGSILIILLFIFFGFMPKNEQSWIRINQLGYLPHTIKVAVLGSKEIIKVEQFFIHDARTNEVVFLYYPQKYYSWLLLLRLFFH